MKVVLRRAAERDFEQIALWYDRQRSGLGSEFMDSARERLASVRENPEAYPVVIEGIRRALLRRFPYGLFYLTEPDRLIVIGFLMCVRAPVAGRTAGSLTVNGYGMVSEVLLRRSSAS